MSANLFESDAFLSLTTPRQEARLLAEAFAHYWSPQFGTRLTVLSERVTYEELVSRLYDSVEETQPDDIYIFYYSGHGFTQHSKSYLALANSSLGMASSTCIALDHIIEILSPIQRKMILIDACKSGGVTWDGFFLNTLSSIPSISEFTSNRSIALISAASAHEDTCQGMFTNSLIDGMRHFAHISEKVVISAYFEYVYNHVSAETKGKQNPSISFSGTPLYLEFFVVPKDGENSALESVELSKRRTKTKVNTAKQIKVLAVFTNPDGSNHLRLENEDRVMRESIKLSLNREHINLDIIHAVRIDDFARALLENSYDIIHFSGHGTGDGLIFEDEKQQGQIISKDALVETLSAYSPPINCVLLNACYSSSHSDNLSMGVPYTIVMDGPISDEGATEFTRGFYDAIGAGRDIEFAYKEGCRRIKLKNLSGEATPILITK